MTQALIEKENDPKVYCSVPKVITYLLHLYKSSFKPILPENFASHDTKKIPSRLFSSPTALNTI